MKSILAATLLVVFWLSNCDAKISSKCPPERITEADQCAKKGFFLLNNEFDGHEGNINKYCRYVKLEVN